jgi:HlyD family secretion protein
MLSFVNLPMTLRAKLPQANKLTNLAQMTRWGVFTAFVVALPGCIMPEDAADAQTNRSATQGAAQAQSTAAVDVAIAATAPLQAAREYTGTTQPLQEVAIRAQAEGQLRQLNADVGDRVQQGQTLAQIDDSLLNAATAEAEAELAARRSEISQLQTQVTDARTQVEQSRLQLQQAESDADRYDQLARDGAVAQQQAEQFRTQARTAVQVLQSAQERVRNQQQAIVAAMGRVKAQQAVVAQQQERRSYAVLASPINGVVLTRSTEIGSLVQIGNELLRVGDFSRAKVTVQVSELDLANVKLGGAATVKLDAFRKEQFQGRVTRISPAANPTSRLVPVEVTIPNPTGRVGSGLLARVSFTQTTTDRVVVPLIALQGDRANGAAAEQTSGTLFIVIGEGEKAKVSARSVTLGERADGKVQILSGLNPGDRFVSRASKPLKEGDSVRLSILSEK